MTIGEVSIGIDFTVDRDRAENAWRFPGLFAMLLINTHQNVYIFVCYSKQMYEERIDINNSGFSIIATFRLSKKRLSQTLFNHIIIQERTKIKLCGLHILIALCDCYSLYVLCV